MFIILYFSFVNFLMDLCTNSVILDRKHLLDFSSILAHFNLRDFPAKKSFLIAQYDYKAHKVFIPWTDKNLL